RRATRPVSLHDALPISADSVERHVADTLKGGGHVGERELVELLCRGAASEVRYLEALGAIFETEGGRYRLGPSGDHSRARVLETDRKSTRLNSSHVKSS